MPERQYRTLTKRIVDRLAVDGKDAVFWDSDLPGFGIRILASRALALGEGLPVIGELLGHQQVNTTARYAHLARESVRTSTAKVAESIGANILTE